MTTLDEVLRDLADECSALDRLLGGLAPDAWFTPTPAEGWDIRDTVSHLADTDDLACDCATGGPRDLMAEATERGPDGFTAWQVAKGRDRTPQEVLEWWRSSSRRLLGALERIDPRERIPWGPNRMGAVSFATARMMETWAHGLDCFAAAGVEPDETDRLRHVAFIGLRALPYAFGRAGLEGPGPVRLELRSPSGQTWEWGPKDAPTVIGGTASDWCRVATQRDRGDERSRLEARGPDAQAILRHAQAYL